MHRLRYRTTASASLFLVGIACGEADLGDREATYTGASEAAVPAAALRIATGARARVQGSPGAPMVWLFTSEEASDLSIGMDPMGPGMQTIAEEGYASGVPTGTTVEVLGQGDRSTHVVVREQGRVYSGRRGWLPSAQLVERAEPAPPSGSFPKYTVLEELGASIHVLVPTLRKSTARDELSRIADEIALRERATEVYLYSTRAAYEINVNGSQSARDDQTLNRGLLGRLKNGVFESWP